MIDIFKTIASSQLRRNVLSGMLSTVLKVGVTFISYPLYIKYLGYEQLGVWMVLSTVLTFVHMCNLGMGPAVTKLVSEEAGRQNWAGIQNYVTTALWTLASMGSVALVILVIFGDPIISAFRLNQQNAEIAKHLLPYVGFLTIYAFLIQILTATLSGLGRIDQVNYRDSCCQAVSLGISTTLLAFGFGIKSLIIGMSISYVLLHVSSLILLRRLIRLKLFRFTWCAASFKKLIGFGGGVLSAGILSMLMSPFNKFMISRYLGVESVPIYCIAFNGSMQIRSLIETGLRAVMPEVSRLKGEANILAYRRIQQIYRRSIRLIWTAGLPLFALIIVFAPILLRLWLGNNQPQTLVPIFRIMTLGSFLSLLCVPAYYILMGVHGIKHCLISTEVQICANVASVVGLGIVLGSFSIYVFGISVLVAHTATCIYILWNKMRILDSDGSDNPMLDRELT